jgi:phosphoenolpyruvate carboxylase
LSIYKAKEELTAISRKYGSDLLMVGPPARGGGGKHTSFTPFRPKIENNEIQITVQGQTIKFKFWNFRIV